MKELKQPTSIRWNKERMDFVREKEGLETVQRVITFLLDKYYWDNRDAGEKRESVLDDRTNPLINAARGRDKSGVNEDEWKRISKGGGKNKTTINVLKKVGENMGIELTYKKKQY